MKKRKKTVTCAVSYNNLHQQSGDIKKSSSTLFRYLLFYVISLLVRTFINSRTNGKLPVVGAIEWNLFCSHYIYKRHIVSAFSLFGIFFSLLVHLKFWCVVRWSFSKHKEQTEWASQLIDPVRIATHIQYIVLIKVHK